MATMSAPFLSHAAVLDGLRLVVRRKLTRRDRHDEVLVRLTQWDFITWRRQPASAHLADLTTDGETVFYWLATLEATPWWRRLRSRPYLPPRRMDPELATT